MSELEPVILTVDELLLLAEDSTELTSLMRMDALVVGDLADISEAAFAADIAEVDGPTVIEAQGKRSFLSVGKDLAEQTEAYWARFKQLIEIVVDPFGTFAEDGTFVSSPWGKFMNVKFTYGLFRGVIASLTVIICQQLQKINEKTPSDEIREKIQKCDYIRNRFLYFTDLGNVLPDQWLFNTFNTVVLDTLGALATTTMSLSETIGYGALFWALGTYENQYRTDIQTFGPISIDKATFVAQNMTILGDLYVITNGLWAPMLHMPPVGETFWFSLATPLTANITKGDITSATCNATCVFGDIQILSDIAQISQSWMVEIMFTVTEEIKDYVGVIGVTGAVSVTTKIIDDNQLGIFLIGTLCEVS